MAMARKWTPGKPRRKHRKKSERTSRYWRTRWAARERKERGGLQMEDVCLKWKTAMAMSSVAITRRCVFSVRLTLGFGAHFGGRFGKKRSPMTRYSVIIIRVLLLVIFIKNCTYLKISPPHHCLNCESTVCLPTVLLSSFTFTLICITCHVCRPARQSVNNYTSNLSPSLPPSLSLSLSVVDTCVDTCAAGEERVGKDGRGPRGARHVNVRIEMEITFIHLLLESVSQHYFFTFRMAVLHAILAWRHTSHWSAKTIPVRSIDCWISNSALRERRAQLAAVDIGPHCFQIPISYYS